MEKRLINCIIVHGCPSTPENNPIKRTYDKHWMPWLKKRLENEKIKTEIPLMPTPWRPEYNLWKKEFGKLNVNENTILIGHSCGGAFLVRWLAETKRKIKKLILVSPGKPGKESRKSLSDLYGNKVIKGIDKYVEEGIVIFTADDDYKYHIDGAYEYKNELNAEVIHLGKGYGHFTRDDMGTEEFPELLKEIMK